MRFKQAVQLDPKNVEARVNLGKTQLTQGHVNEAISALLEGLRLDPGNNSGQATSEPGVSPGRRRKECDEIAESSTESPGEPANDLIGDFFVPDWQVPPPTAREKGAMISFAILAWSVRS